MTNLYKYNGKNQGDNINLVGKEEINLSFLDQLINIEFAALDFHVPYENKYQYQLLGQSETWVDIGTKHELTFAKLDPGSYVLKIKGSNNRNIFGKETTLKINIDPPWYKTTAAYLLWFVLGLGLAYSLYSFLLSRNMAQAKAQRLQELDAVKSQLYTNITHEFRTPLTVILGMADQVKNDPKNWFNEGLSLIQRNGQQLLGLINQILDLSKIESGHMSLNWVQGDVISYLHYLTESFHSLADSKDVRLHFLTELKELQMDHGPEKLQQVVSNLLSNAVKFTPSGGDVYFSVGIKNQGPGSKGQQQVAESKKDLLLEIRDTGIGIPAKDLPHIFDRFYQVDASSTRKGEGTGIGLALTKELVKLMGGSIAVESGEGTQWEGKGTKFTVLLPISKKTDKSGSKPKRQPMETISGEIYLNDEKMAVAPLHKRERPLVLLIEDNADVVTYLASFLSSEYKIATAADGREGVEKAFEIIPDLIVSDVMMPKMDGFEVCATLKLDERTNHIPIILLTAKSDQTAKMEGLSQGADAYLAKPFNEEELLVRMAKLIDLRRRLQERFSQPGVFRKLADRPVDSPETIFMKKAIAIVEENMSNEHFGMPELCRQLAMSRTNLFRKITALTGKSATRFIRRVRLEKSKELLETTDLSISEITFQTGFRSAAYFSRVFKEAFGKPPSDFRK